MKKIYLVACFLLLMPGLHQAQCENGRYRDKIFSAANVQSNIVYGANQTYADINQQLLLDVYSPSGDTETARPLVIMAHGGYFLSGDKTFPDVVPICTDLAEMGYVTASINYRMGINIQASLTSPFMDAIMRAVQDMRAAIRFFRKSVAENGNPYGINPNEIYIGGVSAGGFTALHLAYMDNDEIPASINQSNPGLSGGVEGVSGNAGYSSSIKGIISISGALGDTLWIKPGDTPAFLAHGTADSVVPFDSDMLTMFGFYDISEVDGSSSIHAKLDNAGIENCFEIYWGQDHTPEMYNQAYYDTTLSIMSNFLSHYVCPSIPLDCEYRQLAVSVDEADNDTGLMLYPNPSSSYVYLAGKDARIVRVMDAAGKNIALQHSRTYIDLQGIEAGIYLVEIEKNGKKLIRRLVVD